MADVRKVKTPEEKQKLINETQEQEIKELLKNPKKNIWIFKRTHENVPRVFLRKRTKIVVDENTGRAHSVVEGKSIKVIFVSKYAKIVDISTAKWIFGIKGIELVAGNEKLLSNPSEVKSTEIKVDIDKNV